MKHYHQKQVLLASALLSLGLISANAFAEDNVPLAGTTTNTGATMQPVKKSQNTGQEFLANNKLQPGVVTLPDGLQYKVISDGTGPKPTDSDVVTVNYAGTLIDGTEFDSSYKRGEPTSFPVNAVIPGWTEALKLMKTGSTWMLYIPANLAYGAQGAPPAIGPNQTLIFKVDLISITQ